MLKKDLVRLKDEERAELQAVVRKLKDSSQKVRRAQILLKANPGRRPASFCETRRSANA